MHMPGHVSEDTECGAAELRDDRSILRQLFDTAVAAADPGAALLRFLPASSDRPIVVVGAGKASPAMAGALSEYWTGPVKGAVVTPYGNANGAGRIAVLEARHPVPDSNGLQAALHLRELVSGLGPDDLVIALISGGGSSLLPCPPKGLALADEIALNEALLESGAPISAMNAIRKQVSLIKGGRLAAAAAPARVMTYIVSDVPGDEPAQVASGPTVADERDARDAAALIARYRIRLPGHIVRHIRSAADPAPLPTDQAFANSETHIIASADMALRAAAAQASAAGLTPVIVSDAIEGEAREVGRVMAALAKDVSRHGRLAAKPAVLLSGGETSVTMRGSGRGGRNTEFLLSFALEIEGWKGIAALAADTDGIDGSGGHAGAFADGSTGTQIAASGQDPAALLNANNSHAAFDAVQALLVTGPTGTNVNDFRAVIVR